MTNKRKVSFYKLSQEKHILVPERNITQIRILSNVAIEENFDLIYRTETTDLLNGNKAIIVQSPHSEYVVEFISYENHISFIKIGQQNLANTVALRDQVTLETENVPMSPTQQLELFTFCLIDFQTGIISYIGVNGAPKISAIRSLFDNILLDNNSIHTKLASIMTNDILQTLVRKSIISKLTITVAVPSDDVLSNVIGLEDTDFDSLRDIKTRTATYKLVGTRNKNIFQTSSKLAELIAAIKNKFGDNLKGLTANAKDMNEDSQAYNLLQYSFTKTVRLGDEDSIILTENDFYVSLQTTYNSNKEELLRYSNI